MKGKKLLCGILAVMMSGSLPMQEFAEERAVWRENQAEIHVGRTGFQNYYDISYLNAETGQFELDYVYGFKDSICLLMIDGGFVPFSCILFDENGAVHVSFADLKVPLELELLQGEEVGIVTLKNEKGKELELRYANNQMKRLEDEVYVPLRLVAEFFGCEVMYISDYQKEFCNDIYKTAPKIRIITVETPKIREKIYTKEEALQILQDLSEAEYRQIKEDMRESKRTLTEYDPKAIFDSGKKLGRYDIYKWKGFEELPVFFNRYTGEVYGSNPYTGFLSIGEGFSDISKAI